MSLACTWPQCDCSINKPKCVLQWEKQAKEDEEWAEQTRWAQNKALQILYEGIRKMAVRYPGLAPEFRKIRDKAKEAECWND